MKTFLDNISDISAFNEEKCTFAPVGLLRFVGICSIVLHNHPDMLSKRT